jgi:hypothetical protein
MSKFGPIIETTTAQETVSMFVAEIDRRLGIIQSQMLGARTARESAKLGAASSELSALAEFFRNATYI